MNVLILDTFITKSKSEQNQLNNYKLLIEKYIKSYSEKNGIDGYYIHTASFSDIDKILYSASIAIDNDTNKKTNYFNMIDFIFIVGSDETLPHSEYGKKLLTLIKVSFDSKKFIFLSGSSFFSFLFLFTCPNYNEINIINDNNNAFKIISSVDLIPYDISSHLNLKDRFLNFTTGDLYSFDCLHKKWIPLENIGYHNRLLSIPIYDKYNSRVVNFRDNLIKIRDFNKNNSIFSNIPLKSTEVKCNTIINMTNHWLLNSIPSEFLVESDSKWNAHPIVLTNKGLEYLSLVESSKGIMIIEKDNCLACNFYISSKYKYSDEILRRFIEKKIDFLYNYKKKSDFKTDKKIKNIPNSINILLNSNNYINERLYKREGDHVGVNFSKKNKLFYEYNSIEKEEYIPNRSSSTTNTKKKKVNIKGDTKESKENKSKDIVNNNDDDSNKKIITSMHPLALENFLKEEQVIKIKLKKVIKEDPYKNLSQTEIIKKEFERINKELNKKEQLKIVKSNHKLKSPNERIEVTKETNSILYPHKVKGCYLTNESQIEFIHYLYQLNNEELSEYYKSQARIVVSQLVSMKEKSIQEKKQINGFTISSIDEMKKLTFSKRLNSEYYHTKERKENPSLSNNNSTKTISNSNSIYDSVLTSTEYRKSMFHNLYPYVNYDLMPQMKEAFIPTFTYNKIKKGRKIIKCNFFKVK